MKEKKILIYGINKQAQQLYYYLTNEGRKVEAFIVDELYFRTPYLLETPVICFEQMVHLFSPKEYSIILSFGYKNMVKNRQEKYNACTDLGYELSSFISKEAKVYTDQIGQGVIIYPNTIVEPFVKIGNGCFIEASCSIGHHGIIGNFDFFSLGVTTGGEVTIGDNCFFGLASTIASGKKVECRSVIGAGVCVTRDISKGEVLRHSEAIALSKEPSYYI